MYRSEKKRKNTKLIIGEEKNSKTMLYAISSYISIVTMFKRMKKFIEGK